MKMKLKSYFSISIFLIISLFNLQSAYSQIVPGQVTLHEADETIPYNWFSYVPLSANKLRTNYIVVIAEGGNFNYDDNTEAVRSIIQGKANLPQAQGFILLGASIPRSQPSDIYAVAFDKKCFLESTDPFYQRPDLKINMMIDQLIIDLIEEGYNVHDKVFLEGFSNEAMFAQRYCLLHPERVQAIAAGQCGGYLTLPVGTYLETPLEWAIGVNDFKGLVAYSFNQEVYEQVPQFIYIGDQDNLNSHFNPNPSGFWTQEQIDFINNIFGNTDPIRIENECNYMTEIGCNIQFKLYPGVGHEITSEMNDDVWTFLRSYTDSSPLTLNVPLDFNSIQEAIDAALNGDTILVSDGTFQGSGNKNINFNGKEITVKSENGPDNCVIDCEGEGRGFVFENGENEDSVLQGIKIINGQEEIGGGIYINNSSPKIIDCIISENSGEHGAGIAGFNTSAIFSNCKILNNNATGSGVNYFHSSSPTIINSIISKNTAGHGAGLFFYESTGNVVNCTITENTASGAGGIYCNGSNPTVVNTIFWDNSPDEFGFDDSNPSISYCLIQGGYQGEGNIDDDPLFVDPENNDYHLSGDSPCKNAGNNNVPGLPESDQDGNPRIVNGVVDIGAYEYVSSCMGDFEPDGDVDGSDLVIWMGGITGISLSDVADEFGRTDCPPPNSPCPPEMAYIADFCIDRWEAHIVDQSPYEIPTQGVAASLPGVVPQGYISQVVAADACASADKRLCSNDEWLRACQGPNGWQYPYGPEYESSTCNDFRSQHPIYDLYPNDPDWSDLNNPQLNQLADTVDLTGQSSQCVTPEGVFDLVGNLHEWTSDPTGSFRGGYYVEAYINGAGCSYNTTAHNTFHHDFSTGFRCCKDPY